MLQEVRTRRTRPEQEGLLSSQERRRQWRRSRANTQYSGILCWPRTCLAWSRSSTVWKPHPEELDCCCGLEGSRAAPHPLAGLPRTLCLAPSRSWEGEHMAHSRSPFRRLLVLLLQEVEEERYLIASKAWLALRRELWVPKEEEPRRAGLQYLLAFISLIKCFNRDSRLKLL